MERELYFDLYRIWSIPGECMLSLASFNVSIILEECKVLKHDGAS